MVLRPTDCLRVFRDDEFLCVVAEDRDYSFGFAGDSAEGAFDFQFARTWAEFKDAWVQRGCAGLTHRSLPFLFSSYVYN